MAIFQFARAMGVRYMGSSSLVVSWIVEAGISIDA